MKPSLRPVAPQAMTSGCCRRHGMKAGTEDSPYSPFLRRWIGHQAARHRDLLLNIHAATRVRVAPVVVTPQSLFR